MDSPNFLTFVNNKSALKMKRSFFVLLALLFALASPMNVQARGIQFVEASDLTMIGKLFPDTPNPYYRVDTDAYGGFTDSEFKQMHHSSGIAVLFRTDSESIFVKSDYAQVGNGGSTGILAVKGFDLYIKDKKGNWTWAGITGGGKSGETKALLHFNESGRMCECMLYLPLFSELKSVEIGVFEDRGLEPLPNPFKHRIGVFGSSFTQGYGCSRSGMTWTAQMARMTGMQFINFGCSGNSKLQDYFAEVLADAPVDAYVFDAFSNPTADLIEERLIPFISILRAKNPDRPIVFIKSLHRSWRNFNADVDRRETDKMDMAEKMMKKVVKDFPNVYYVTTTNASDPRLDTTVDGTHPGDYGYTCMAESLKAPLLEILAKHGIR